MFVTRPEGRGGTGKHKLKGRDIVDQDSRLIGKNGSST
jgi:hypothetical protein